VTKDVAVQNFDQIARNCLMWTSKAYQTVQHRYFASDFAGKKRMTEVAVGCSSIAKCFVMCGDMNSVPSK
jgi:hypothetical protein